jgi:hypothetical protein
MSWAPRISGKTWDVQIRKLSLESFSETTPLRFPPTVVMGTEEEEEATKVMEDFTDAIEEEVALIPCKIERIDGLCDAQLRSRWCIFISNRLHNALSYKLLYIHQET